MSNHTILLIDYEPRSIERFRQPLVAAGYVVEVATDGISGVEAFHRISPKLVLVEAMIPKKHGFEVCQELKRTPHGRGTPIIITTGVYKGRKYRTQALHIYGCDEYIEKPIAAEQLLAIVGRFLGAPGHGDGRSSSGSQDRAPEPPPSEPEPRETVAAPSRGPADSGGTRGASPKPSNLPKAMVADLTEDEIMARLDAILPGIEASAGSAFDAAPAPPALPTAVVGPTEASSDDDPFRQMQAELTAELGSLSTALALDSAPVLEPIPSDQASTPSLLESLIASEPESAAGPEAAPDRRARETDAEPFDAPLPAPVEMPADTSAGQVVNFDAKRSRKNKKGNKKGSPSIAEPAARVPVAADPSPSRETPRRAKPAAESGSAEFQIPSGSVVESTLSSPNPSRGVPVWIWAAVGIAALVLVYWVFLRGGSERTQATPPEPIREAGAPAALSTPPAQTSSADSPSVARQPAKSPDASLVLNAVGTEPPARVEPRASAAPPAAAEKAHRDDAAAATATTTDASATAPAPANSIQAWKPAAKIALPPPTAAPTAPPAPEELSGTASGVEQIANVAEPVASKPAIAPGTLIELAEADTPPVSLARTLPVYSMQARSLKIQGTVVMNVLVNERGTVDQVVLVTGVKGGDLNEAAMKAARQWTYRPATKDGVPVKVWKTEQVAFKI